jgi:hypothetical protein
MLLLMVRFRTFHLSHLIPNSRYPSLENEAVLVVMKKAHCLFHFVWNYLDLFDSR